MSDKDFLDELNELDPGGVLAYTPLMHKLEENGYTVAERKDIAISYLPIVLSCALQNNDCLDDIKNVAEKYPELIPEILTAALNLRNDKNFKEWTKYESKGYGEFVSTLEKVILES